MDHVGVVRPVYQTENIYNVQLFSSSETRNDLREIQGTNISMTRPFGDLKTNWENIKVGGALCFFLKFDHKFPTMTFHFEAKL